MYRYIKLKLFIAALILFGCLATSILNAADGSSDKKSDKFSEISISAAHEPVPALHYRLMPPITALKTGNAALDWSKLTSVMPADLDEYHNIKEGALNYRDLLKLPFNEFKNEHLEYADKFLKVSGYSFLKYAALKKQCDWQDPTQDGINMLLPSLNSLRKIAYLVALEARVKVAKGDYESALELLSYNFSLAQDLSEGITLIQNLVGIGVAAMNYKVIDDIVAQPDSPNLYWALTMMPTPLIDMRNAYESEMDVWIWSTLEDMDTKILSVEQANAKINELLQCVDDNVPLAAYVAAGYVPGKKYLIENGYDPRRVELMPASQVVLLSQWMQYLPVRDNMFKFLFVTYYQGKDYIKKANKEFVNVRASASDLNIFYEFLPAISRCKFLVTEMHARSCALQCVEAIRMYVAKYNKLPESLSDIKVVPVPENPFTGKEFRYYLDGDTAVLDIEVPDDERDFYGFRIKLKN